MRKSANSIVGYRIRIQCILSDSAKFPELVLTRQAIKFLPRPHSLKSLDQPLFYAHILPYGAAWAVNIAILVDMVDSIFSR